MVEVQKIRKEEVLKIYCDGASRGNPGPAAWANIFVKNDEIIYKNSGFIGNSTNNTAEYNAIINALKEAEKYTRWKIEVYSDSELIVRQINKVYRIKKDHLSELCSDVYTLRQKFEDVKFAHVSREHKFIEIANKLCNKCLDENYGVENILRR